MLTNLPYDIINELSFYINNNSKIKLEKISKSLKDLTYFYYIVIKNYNLTDNILKQNKFSKLIKLNVENNKNITTCEPFKDTLIELNASGYNCGINDNGLKKCHKIQILYANNNNKITTCEPFKNTLIKLYAFCYCGINDEGLKNCNKIKILKTNNNITTYEPFKNTLIILNNEYINKI